MLEVETADPLAEPKARRWTVEEYYRLGDEGWFQNERVELIDGEIIKMPPQKDVHAGTVSFLHRLMIKVFGDGYAIRSQVPVHLSDYSEPEPDIAVVRGNERDFVHGGHPTTAVLVIEVSDSTLLFDQRTKSSLYAAADVQGYWIINIPGKQVEVYRNPIADSSKRFGYRYGEVTVVRPPENVSPLALPSVQIPAADLLP
jgi:Uma2 family endonuclease